MQITRKATGPDPTWTLVSCDRDTVPSRAQIIAMIRARRIGFFDRFLSRDPRAGLVPAVEIAQELGEIVQHNTINKWARDGEIYAVKIPDLIDGITRHRWYVDRDSLMDRIERMRRKNG